MNHKSAYQPPNQQALPAQQNQQALPAQQNQQTSAAHQNQHVFPAQNQQASTAHQNQQRPVAPSQQAPFAALPQHQTSFATSSSTMSHALPAPQMMMSQAMSGEISGLKDVIRRKDQEITKLNDANIQLKRDALSATNAQDLKSTNAKQRQEISFLEAEVLRLKNQLNYASMQNAAPSSSSNCANSATISSNAPQGVKLESSRQAPPPPSQRFHLLEPGRTLTQLSNRQHASQGSKVLSTTANVVNDCGGGVTTLKSAHVGTPIPRNTLLHRSPGSWSLGRPEQHRVQQHQQQQGHITASAPAPGLPSAAQPREVPTHPTESSVSRIPPGHRENPPVSAVGSRAAATPAAGTVGAACSSGSSSGLPMTGPPTSELYLKIRYEKLIAFLAELPKTKKMHRAATMVQRAIIDSALLASNLFMAQFASLLKEASDLPSALDKGSAFLLACIQNEEAEEELRKEIVLAHLPLIEAFVAQNLPETVQRNFVKAFACVAAHVESSWDHVIWTSTFHILATSPAALAQHIRNGTPYAHELLETLLGHIHSRRCFLDGNTHDSGLTHLCDQLLLPSDTIERCRRRMSALACFKVFLDHESPALSILSYRGEHSTENVLQSVVLMTHQELLNRQMESELDCGRFVIRKDPVLQRHKDELIIISIKWLVTAGESVFGLEGFGANFELSEACRLSFDVAHCWPLLYGIVTIISVNGWYQTPPLDAINSELHNLEAIAEKSRPIDIPRDPTS